MPRDRDQRPVEPGQVQAQLGDASAPERHSPPPARHRSACCKARCASRLPGANAWGGRGVTSASPREGAGVRAVLGRSRRSTSCASRAKQVRDITFVRRRRAREAVVKVGSARGRGRRQRLRPHVPAAPGRKIEVDGQPLKTRDDLSMAYTPGVARVCMAIQPPDKALDADDQGQHRRRRDRRHGRARPGRHRPGGGDAGHGGQGAAVQGVRRRRRVPAVRHEGRRRDRRLREGGRADVRRRQPRGHRRAALLRDRAPAARRARHPRLPRRPARHRDRRAGRAAQRAPVVGKRAEDMRVVVVGAGAAGRRVRGDPARPGVGDVVVGDRRRRALPGGDVWTPSARSSPSAPTRDGVQGTADEVLAGADVFSASRARAGRRPRCARWRRRDRLRDGQPGARGAARGGRRATSRSWPPAARTTRTRSTTCSRSRACSAARSTCARGRSTRR